MNIPEVFAGVLVFSFLKEEVGKRLSRPTVFVYYAQPRKVFSKPNPKNELSIVILINFAP